MWEIMQFGTTVRDEEWATGKIKYLPFGSSFPSAFMGSDVHTLYPGLLELLDVLLGTSDFVKACNLIATLQSIPISFHSYLLIDPSLVHRMPDSKPPQ